MENGDGSGSPTYDVAVLHRRSSLPSTLTLLVNVIAPIFTSETDMFKQTIFYPLALFANHVYGTSLDVHVESDTYDTEELFIGLGEQTTQQSDVPYLDVSATYQENGDVILNVVNRHRDEAIATDIVAQEGTFAGPFEVYEVNGPDVKAQNDFDQELVRTERKPQVAASGGQFTYTFPPHSFTMLKGRIERR